MIGRVCKVVCCICVLAAAVAEAKVEQCVQINSGVVCTTGEDCYNVSDCHVDCVGKKVTLIGRCAASAGTADESVLDELNIASDSASNVYCWCKMVSPVLTKWVMRYNYETGGSCAMYCARGCGNAFLYDMDVDKKHRSLMFGNLAE